MFRVGLHQFGRLQLTLQNRVDTVSPGRERRDALSWEREGRVGCERMEEWEKQEWKEHLRRGGWREATQGKQIGGSNKIHSFIEQHEMAKVKKTKQNRSSIWLKLPGVRLWKCNIHPIVPTLQWRLERVNGSQTITTVSIECTTTYYNNAISSSNSDSLSGNKSSPAAPEGTAGQSQILSE